MEQYKNYKNGKDAPESDFSMLKESHTRLFAGPCKTIYYSDNEDDKEYQLVIWDGKKNSVISKQTLKAIESALIAAK